jgi:5-aminolevulinate synthase
MLFWPTGDKMLKYDQFFKQALQDVKKEGRYRYFAHLEKLAGSFPYATLHNMNLETPLTEKVIVWCGNDYLGLGENPAVIQAMKKALDAYGTGAGGTRNISGTSILHVELERKLATLHGREAALLFTSGYAANEATLSTLLKYLPNCIVFSDECNHASIIHGICYSKAKKEVFKHNDLKDLEAKLKAYPLAQPKIIVFESLYSMDGDFSPVSEICDLAQKYNALTYVDEVHAIGVYGKKGMGYVESIGESHRIDILQSNFGKAVGVIGGYITASHMVIDFIRSYAPPFIFTTALPPTVVAGVIKSLDLIQEGRNLRERLWSVVDYTKQQLQNAGFYFFDSGSHIIPLIVGEARLCKDVTDRLLMKHRIYVQPINFPTVPRGTERLRITPNPSHTYDMVDAFVEACIETWSYFALPLKKKSA